MFFPESINFNISNGFPELNAALRKPKSGFERFVGANVSPMGGNLHGVQDSRPVDHPVDHLGVDQCRGRAGKSTCRSVRKHPCVQFAHLVSLDCRTGLSKI